MFCDHLCKYGKYKLFLNTMLDQFEIAILSQFNYGSSIMSYPFTKMVDSPMGKSYMGSDILKGYMDERSIQWIRSSPSHL